jgi:hypothetical protein
MPLTGLFQLLFEHSATAEIAVRLRSALGDAGPILLNDDQAHQLADLIDRILDLLRDAQRRRHTN